MIIRQRSVRKSGLSLLQVCLVLSQVFVFIKQPEIREHILENCIPQPEPDWHKPLSPMRPLPDGRPFHLALLSRLLQVLHIPQPALAASEIIPKTMIISWVTQL